MRKLSGLSLLALAAASLARLASTSPPQASLMVGIEPAAPSATNVHLMTTAPFTSTNLVEFPAKLASMTRRPGSLIFSFTGGFDDGGNLYHLLENGNFIMAGPTGFDACPALVWDESGFFLWGTVCNFAGDCLVQLDAQTGAATLVGESDLIGVEALSIDPTDGTLYGTTGFHYDGSPGDIFTFDKATGEGTDTGFDLLDTFGNPPPCTVAGMSFSANGVGYVSIGCGVLGPGSGEVFSFDTTTFTLTPLGDATAGGNGGSMSDLAVIF
ncbi:MAG: hypothetical protein AAF682_28585 [Planctomycetota bacterium]